jgi:hypothetical protein
VSRAHDHALALSENWHPVETAPWQTLVEVRNELMDEPCVASRGFVYKGMVHPNQNYFSTRSGHLVCPTEWRPIAEQSA